MRILAGLGDYEADLSVLHIGHDTAGQGQHRGAFYILQAGHGDIHTHLAFEIKIGDRCGGGDRVGVPDVLINRVSALAKSMIRVRASVIYPFL